MNITLLSVWKITVPYSKITSYPPNSLLLKYSASRECEHIDMEETKKIICLKSLTTWFQNTKSLQRSFSCDSVHLYATATSNALNFHILDDTGFLTNNLNYQECVSLKETTFAQMVRYQPSENFRLLRQTAAFINSPFHWEVCDCGVRVLAL